MPDLQHLLDQIDRLDQRAAKGPWEVWPQTDDDGTTYPEYIEGPMNALFGARGWDNKHYIQEIPEMTMDDAEFIALARAFAPAAAKALRAVIESCEETIRSVDKNLLPDERDHANRDHADMILDAITDALGADDD